MDYYEFNEYYGDPFIHANDWLSGFLAVLSVIILIIFVLMVAYAVTAYVLNAFSLYQLAKKRNFKYAWMAWIPLAYLYIIGALINDKVKIGSLKIPHAAIVLPLVSVAASLGVILSGSIPFIGILLSIVILILEAVYIFAAYYRLFKIYVPKNAVLFTVLSIIFPIVEPFLIFSLRNKTPDFTDIDPLTNDPVNPRCVLALGYGIATVISVLITGAFSFLLGALTILFAVLGIKELKQHNHPITLPLIGLILGIVGILLAIILPALGWNGTDQSYHTWDHLRYKLYDDFYDEDLFNESPYPFI